MYGHKKSRLSSAGLPAIKILNTAKLRKDFEVCKFCVEIFNFVKCFSLRLCMFLNELFCIIRNHNISSILIRLLINCSITLFPLRRVIFTILSLWFISSFSSKYLALMMSMYLLPYSSMCPSLYVTMILYSTITYLNKFLKNELFSGICNVSSGFSNFSKSSSVSSLSFSSLYSSGKRVLQINSTFSSSI